MVLHHLPHHVADDLVGEVGKEIVGGWSSPIPSRLSKGRNMRDGNDASDTCLPPLPDTISKCRAASSAKAARMGRSLCLSRLMPFQHAASSAISRWSLRITCVNYQ